MKEIVFLGYQIILESGECAYSDGSNVKGGTCDLSDAQLWTIDNNGSYYTFTNKSDGKCAGRSGTSINAETCDASTDQQMTFQDQSGDAYRIKTGSGINQCWNGLSSGNVNSLSSGCGYAKRWTVTQKNGTAVDPASL